ncbi:immunoglobulin-like domain-containing protein [Rubritalea tangerina]|uniref:immunoglobulin-like domain-containing protein n=1 Tax=Rubritalea tangerina TaxID=430798 RepID=UPI003613AC05
MFRIHPFQIKNLYTVALSLVLSLQCFALDPADGNIPTPAQLKLTETGSSSRTSSNVYTYNIPITNYPSSIEIEVQGGDGGYAQSGTNNNPTNQASKGGGGINGKATFNIHPTNPGALRPGGQIRLIPGSKGFNRQSGLYAHAVSGGGGGSGLLYHGPLNSDDWRPLIIAGGGGGAYASTVTGKRASNRNGGGGVATENGGRAPNTGYNGGTGGNGGTAGYLHGGGGGGWISAGQQSGGGAGYPSGGDGGVLNVNTSRGAAGGFGCGGGGDGGKLTNINGATLSGGGGGGYSGGGGGKLFYGGGGGGSFVATGQTLNGIVLPSATANANRWTARVAGQLQNGFVSIQTFGDLLSEALPTITAQDITIDFATTAPYINTGVSAQDIYGRSINYSLVSSNVNVNASGTYTMTYKATDQYGQEATESRTVTVRAGSLIPTFDLADSLDITQAGQQTPQIISAFSANSLGDGDNSESLVSFDIKNVTNSSLLATTPTIANNGRLTLTPSANATGVTTLTIVATDNGPDPTVRESVEQTIDLRFNLAPSAGQFLLSSNPDVFSSSVNFSEDASSLVVGTIKSIDPDNPQNLTYTLSGPDKDLFSLGSNNGVLTFLNQPNYETPNDSGGNRTYDLIILSKDPSASAGFENQTISAVTVDLIDVNEPPSQPTLSNTSVNENTTVVGILNATDPDLNDNSVNFEVADHPSTDGQFFKITTFNNQHQLEFKTAPDFEDAQDFGNNNTYTVSVIASSNGQSTSKLFIITVNNVEEPLSSPVLTLTNDPVYENQTVIGTVSSTDSDDTPISYAIAQTPVTDWERVDIDPTTGVLSFKTAPDYENPDDVNSNHVYDINITVTSGPESLTRGFSIPIANVDEAPTKPTLQNNRTSIPENTQVVDVLESTDPEDDAITFEISQTEGLDSYLFSVNPATNELYFTNAPDFENLVFNDEVEVFTVCVIARSGDKTSKEFFEITVSNVDEAPFAPDFANPSDSNVVENTTTVGTIVALDPDEGDSVTYAISLPDATDSKLFDIDENSGLLSFKQAPNFEAPLDEGSDNTYDVAITATDAGGKTTMAILYVTVTNVSEPQILPSITNQTIPEDETEVGSVQSNAGATFKLSTDSGADTSLFTIDETTGLLSFLSAPDFENPSDQNQNNVYEVDVIASFEGIDQTASFSITVTDDRERPTPPKLENYLVPENRHSLGYLISTDADSPEVTFSISPDEGADSDLFTIYNHTSPGTLNFKVQYNPNYEFPIDHNQDNVYEVVVIATADGDSTKATLYITVLNVEEGPNAINLSNNSIEENQTYIGILNATDDDGTALTYHLVEPSNTNDNTLFYLDPNTGDLSFITPPDYESPQDYNADNRFAIEYRVIPEDNIGISTGTVFISVTDINPYSNRNNFRAEFKLAADGSEDWLDRSGNGIPNIGYMMLGLGAPSNPALAKVTNDTPGLPYAKKIDGYDKIVSFTYSIHSAPFFDSGPEVSENLQDWYRPFNPALHGDTVLTPLSVETSAINEHFNKVTLYYLTSEDPNAPPRLSSTLSSI